MTMLRLVIARIQGVIAALHARWNLTHEHECVPYVTDTIAETSACRTCGRDMTGEL